MSETYWKHFDHRADIGIEGAGPAPARAFAQAAMALMAIMCDLETIEKKEARHIEFSGENLEILFYDFINELIYLITSEGFVFSQAEVSISEQGLQAEVAGEPMDISRHKPSVEVKAASFSSLEVTRNPEGLFIARCIVDV